MTTTTAAVPSPAPARGWIVRLARERPRRGLVIALALSLALHGVLSLWPAEVPTTPDEVPLQATITEMPPPPAPTPVAAAKPRPRPRRATAPPAPAAAPEPVATAEAEAPPIEPTPEAIATGPEPATEEVVAAEPAAATPVPELSAKTLPRRVDLVYKAFLGTHGFVIGEATYLKQGFRPLLEARAADILNPDVACCGGILELKEIAAMAEPFMVAMSPHNYNSTTLGLSSTVHASAVMPNFIITEYFLPFVEFCDKISPNQLKPKNGYIDLPTAPGLGIDIDEEALKQHPAKVYPTRKLRQPADEGP